MSTVHDPFASSSPATATKAAERRRGRGPLRRLLRGFSTILIVAGTLMLADAGITLVWQEPLTALYASINQSQLSGQLDRIERAGPSTGQRHVLRGLPTDPERVAYLARELRRTAHNGQPIGRITIPRIYGRTSRGFVVIQGTDTSSLQKGPGHYPATPLPGQRGTVAIAGHRTTYLAPFRRVDRLRHGDRVIVTMPYARFTYRVQFSRIVRPTDLGVTRRVGYDRLILSACHPLYSASHRIIIFSRLVRVTPLGGARRSA